MFTETYLADVDVFRHYTLLKKKQTFAGMWRCSEPVPEVWCCNGVSGI